MKKEEENVTLSTRKEVVMSYILASSSRNWGVYGERLLMQLVLQAQDDIQGQNFRSGESLCPQEPSFDFDTIKQDFGSQVVVSMPIRTLTGDSETNYEFIMDSLQQLQRQLVVWDKYCVDSKGNLLRTKSGEIKRKRVSVQMIGRVEYDMDLKGYISVWVDKDVWRAMEDFSKGFRAIDLNIVKKLKGRYSLRFYQLLSRQDRRINYSIDHLKQILGIPDKYPRTCDFINNVVKPVKKELDRVSPYTFEYSLNRDTPSSGEVRKGMKPVTSISFYPVHLLQNDNIYNQKGVDKGFVFMDTKITRILKDMGFTSNQINNNIEIFEAAYKFGNAEGGLPLEQFLYDLRGKKGVAANFQGYVINAIKNMLAERYHYVFKSNRQKKKEEKMEQELLKNNIKPIDDVDIPSLDTLFGEL